MFRHISLIDVTKLFKFKKISEGYFFKKKNGVMRCCSMWLLALVPANASITHFVVYPAVSVRLAW